MTDLRGATPPESVELDQWSLNTGTQLRTLRTSLHQALIDQELVDSDNVLLAFFDDVVLVATELATNALQHGLPPTTVRLLRNHTQLVLDVADHDPGTIPQATAASLTRDRGRGLAITHAIAHQAGWYNTGPAKHIWAAFSISHTRNDGASA